MHNLRKATTAGGGGGEFETGLHSLPPPPPPSNSSPPSFNYPRQIFRQQALLSHLGGIISRCALGRHLERLYFLKNSPSHTNITHTTHTTHTHTHTTHTYTHHTLSMHTSHAKHTHTHTHTQSMEFKMTYDITRHIQVNPFLPDCKTSFSQIFYIFTLKEHFEKYNIN